jgi:hypothetical protein
MDVEFLVVPPSVTDQLVPLPNPVSVNVTVYAATNATCTGGGAAPFTVRALVGIPDVHDGSDDPTVYVQVPFGSENVIVVPLPEYESITTPLAPTPTAASDDGVPVTFTYQTVPGGRVPTAGASASVAMIVRSTSAELGVSHPTQNVTGYTGRNNKSTDTAAAATVTLLMSGTTPHDELDDLTV